MKHADRALRRMGICVLQIPRYCILIILNIKFESRVIVISFCIFAEAHDYSITKVFHLIISVLYPLSFRLN